MQDQSYDSKHKELLEKISGSDDDGAITEPPAKTIEMMYNSDEDFIYPKPSNKTKTETKNNTKDIIKTKPITKPKPKDNIYSRIKFRCEEYNEEFKNKIALRSHSYSHNRLYLENTEDFDINSSQNMREFYITYKTGSYTEDIDEAINNSLVEIKSFYHFRKIKSFNYKITAECDYKKRTKDEVKITKIVFNTDHINNIALYEYGDFTQWLNFERKYMKAMAMNLSFLD